MGGTDMIAGHATARIQPLDRTDRDQAALTNLQRLAPGDHQLLADILGLTGPAHTSTAPLIEPVDGRYATRRRPSGPHPHGTYNRYATGCHCEPCDQAARDYRANLKLRKAAAS